MAFKKLSPVRLCKQDTCLTYALMRTNTIISIQDAEDIEQHFTLENIANINYLDEYLKRGDIVMWTQDERTALMPTEITYDGRIISNKVLMLRHFGVYEGDGLISDCTISSRDYPFAKTIRMRRIQELENKPTYLLTLKK